MVQISLPKVDAVNLLQTKSTGFGLQKGKGGTTELPSHNILRLQTVTQKSFAVQQPNDCCIVGTGETDNDGLDNGAHKGHLWEKPYLMVRWEKSEMGADAVRTISNRCLLASVQLLQPDHTIHKQGSISPLPFFAGGR